MRKNLYKYKNNKKVMTFAELKNDMAEKNKWELPVTDQEAEIMIMLGLVQNGGEIMCIADKTFEWCERYAKEREANRYLTQEEYGESVKEIYLLVREQSSAARDLETLLRLEGRVELADSLQKLLS